MEGCPWRQGPDIWLDFLSDLLALEFPLSEMRVLNTIMQEAGQRVEKDRSTGFILFIHHLLLFDLVLLSQNL